MAVHHDPHHHEEEMYRANTLGGLAVFGAGLVFLVIIATIAWWLAQTLHH